MVQALERPAVESAESDERAGTAQQSMVEAIHDTLRDAMLADERVVILGEDVGRRGGVFRATAGFLDEFGPERVIDTPLAEAGIIGTRDRDGAERSAADRRDPVPRLHPLRDRRLVREADSQHWHTPAAGRIRPLPPADRPRVASST